MTFEEILDQAMAMLQRRGRLTYSTLKRQFQLDDAALEDVKNEFIYGQRLAVDEEDRVLVWTGALLSTTSPTPAPSPVRAIAPAHVSLAVPPVHLAEKIVTSRSALEGERKQITVLFADLKGSMELLADRDPEEARQLLDPVLERMIEAVHRYEGTVNQVMGDGIMALFGAPIAHEDHAVRACYAALRMQETVTHYGDAMQRSHGVPVQIRVGLNSGEVVVRAIDSSLHMDYTAVGQTTHLAARLEQMARPGSVLITGETLRLAEEFIQVKALGPVAVKGLADQVEVFELVGASSTRTHLQALATRGLTRFVGRQAEFEALRQALERAGTSHGQVVAVIGEPGVGKTRLAYEFTRSHHTHGWLVLESSAVSYGKTTVYLPVRDLLKAYFQLDDRDDRHKIREKLTGKLLTLDTALGPTLPAFLALLDVPVEDRHWQALDPVHRRQRTLEAIKGLLLRESQVQPLFLVFENLHWIDTETQAVLDSLSEGLPTARLLLLVNYRPEYQHGWGSKTYYTQLRLDPLPPVSAEELLQALLGDDPSLVPLKRLLIERTEGNPFFLEESVRALVETGRLVGAYGAYRPLPSLDCLQVPATVQAVLASRIDRLPPEEKWLLQTAAVIGMEVPCALLQPIVGLPEEELRRGLGHLQAAEFLYETSLFPELVYTFKHALTQEVAYGSLLQERRRVLHTRIVEALEMLAGDQMADVAPGAQGLPAGRQDRGQTELMAHNALLVEWYGGSGRINVPDQIERLAHHALRGEVWDKAVTYCQQAGARAHDRVAFREAVAYFEQALQALVHLPAHNDTMVLAIESRLALDRPLTVLGEHGRRLVLLGEAVTLARALDDRVRLGWVLAGMAQALRQTGDTEGAIATGQQALDLATALGASALRMRASYNLAQVYFAVGDFGLAAELLRQNAAAADWEASTPSTDVRIWSQAWLARTLSALGAFAEGQRHGEEALRLSTLARRGATAIVVHGCLGLLYLAKGSLEHAIQVFDQGLALCRASGNRDWLSPIMAGLGSAYALQGRLAEGRALVEEAIGAAMRAGALYNHANGVMRLSEVCRLAGCWDEAWQYACQALDLTRQIKCRGCEAFILHQLGAVQAHPTPLDAAQAEAHYRQALALAEELGMRPLVAHCHLGLGTLYARTGQREQGRAELSTAIAMYRAMAMTFWLPQAEVALAQVEER